MTGDAVEVLLVDLLTEAVTALIAATEADDPPERQYVGHGAIVWDCDQLTTHLLRVRPRLLGDPRTQKCALAHDVQMAVTLIRCWPRPDDRGNPPTPDTIDAAGRQLAVDGWALWKGLTRAWSEGSWPTDIPCSRVTWGVLEPLAPSGGFAGWRLEVAVQL